MKESVLTKDDFVRRYIAGEFGNRPPTWGTLDEYLDSGHFGLVHVRNRVTAGKTWYNVLTCQVPEVWEEASRSYGANHLYISTMGPEKCKVFQGEVMRHIWGLSLHYNTEAKPMREVSAENWKDVTGVWASIQIARFLDDNSVEWLEYLLEEYPDHVVEFSTYSQQWGMVPGFNTVFWEVRKY
jgi:hypothetical protein